MCSLSVFLITLSMLPPSPLSHTHSRVTNKKATLGRVNFLSVLHHCVCTLSLVFLESFINYHSVSHSPVHTLSLFSVKHKSKKEKHKHKHKSKDHHNRHSSGDGKPVKHVRPVDGSKPNGKVSSSSVKKEVATTPKVIDHAIFSQDFSHDFFKFAEEAHDF